ncbi:hypothetical protein LX81_01364 [Palleronia aestuarii]|uniref:Uncharacterized protein n=1 Tax=Palleronia aestuarii TaxID=568105 RepID=A0A2W7Q785_9RHOB|nr:hypothetical protein [Palleronia aestuarii]PZX17639.1 hypothetical protein LX81_01364 [Palleronia aestuarii]
MAALAPAAGFTASVAAAEAARDFLRCVPQDKRASVYTALFQSQGRICDGENVDGQIDSASASVRSVDAESEANTRETLPSGLEPIFEERSNSGLPVGGPNSITLTDCE